VVRRHHPLLGEDLEVLSVNKSVVVVCLTNGSSLKIPRQWTDVDTAQSSPTLQGDSKLCMQGLGELLEILEPLSKRSLSTPS
jgi:hypothetical protein